MPSVGLKRIIALVALAAATSAMAVHAQENAHEIMMGGSVRPQLPILAYGEDPPQTRTRPAVAPRPRKAESAGRAAYCVRTCDGRYFPAPSGDQLEGCKDLCPATETKVFYGGSIDNASAKDGKPYSALQNAFRYREEIVAGCTCNGKDVVGLASIKLKDDRTLRPGDIVASREGFKVVRSLSSGSPKLAAASKADTGRLVISR